MSVQDGDEQDERDYEVFTEFIEEMEKFGNTIGLYTIRANGKRHPLDDEVLAGFDPVVRPFVAATFMLGDIAFSDEVQNPELYTVDATLAQIEHATHVSEAQEILSRYETTGKLFRSDEDD